MVGVFLVRVEGRLVGEKGTAGVKGQLPDSWTPNQSIRGELETKSANRLNNQRSTSQPAES